jgi:hypothetical protein
MQVLRLRFEAQREMTFPTPASNTVRGMLGAALHERGDGSYQRWFAPKSVGGASGLQDPPRPFVLRCAHLNGVTVRAGESYEVALHVFQREAAWLDVFPVLQAEAPMTLDLAAPVQAVRRVRVRFCTPTELKAAGELVAQPDFGTLAARVRDRLSVLRQFYGDGPLELDFAAFGERARAVHMTRCDVERVHAARTSKNTGQTHSLGGFVGDAEYEGELTEFIPYLRAAEWTGVGRQTTWGKGVIEVFE